MANYQNKIAETLSLWWNERSDIFKAEPSNNPELHVIKPTCQDGFVFCDVFAVAVFMTVDEWGFTHYLDGGVKSNPYTKVHKKITRDAYQANKLPLLITRRGTRAPLIVIPRSAFNFFYDYHGRFENPNMLFFVPEFKSPYNVVNFHEFLEWVSPDTVLNLDNNFENGKVIREKN